MDKTQKVLACVIVRMKSTRLKRKALADLAGDPMTYQLIKRLKNSSAIDKIVLCTSRNPEDAILLEKALEWGVEAYAGHEEDVLSRLIETSKIYNADHVLRITGDNPFTCEKNIDRMVEHHILTGADYTRTGRLPLGVTSEVMCSPMLMKLHTLMPDPNQSEYMSFFSFNPDVFHCEVLDPIEGQDRPYYSLTIDYPEDLELANRLYNVIALKGSVPPLSEVIKVLDEDKSYCGVSKDTVIKLPEGKTMTYESLIQMLDEVRDRARMMNAGHDK
ncbi:MAG: hypothetical protein K9K67_00845 [Bacteriovoracaceae bacterium]|nr:hypothetical protein [Bacteriovoracaceae bacterium]